MERNEILSKLADYIDVPADIETEEQAKEFFDKTFGRRDTIATELKSDQSFINSIIGKNIGKLENRVKQFAKDNGVSFDAGDFEGKKAEEIFEVALTKTQSVLGNKISELEKKANSTAPEEFLKEKQTLTQERDFYKKEWENLGVEHENFKTSIVETNRKNKLSQGRDKIFSSIKFAPEANELTILGFKAKLESEIQFDLDEQENIILKDTQGNPIANPNKAGSFYAPEEYIRERAIKDNIFQLNDNGGKPVIKPIVTQVTTQTEAPQRFINERAVV